METTTSSKTRDLEIKLRELENQIVTNPEKLEMFCKQWNNGFHSYSFGNTILIWMQKHDASLCAGYHTWLDKKRYVKKGEKAIAILAPMFFKKTKENDAGEDEEITITRFRAVSVFDVSQTEGEPIELGHSDKIKGNSTLTISQLANIFREYAVVESNGISNGHTDGKTITLSNRDNSMAMVATYFHELAHCMLKHAGTPDRETHELEAEAVSYIVCASVGIENDKAKYYIGNWHGDKAKLTNSGSRIIKTAEKMVRTIETAVTPDS